MSAPTCLPMSPAQAAHHANVSRRTIMRAIETLELSAQRDNRNRWKITPEALENWMNAHCAPSEQPTPETPTLPIALEIELARTQAENAQLRERLASAETDRDHWRDMAQKLADQPRSFWPWKRRKAP